MDLPHVKVPADHAVYRGQTLVGQRYWVIDDSKGVIDSGCFLLEVEELRELGCRTDAEDVQKGQCEEQERPGPSASRHVSSLCWLCLVLVLVDGRRVHEGELFRVDRDIRRQGVTSKRAGGMLVHCAEMVGSAIGTPKSIRVEIWRDVLPGHRGVFGHVVFQGPFLCGAIYLAEPVHTGVEGRRSSQTDRPAREFAERDRLRPTPEGEGTGAQVSQPFAGVAKESRGREREPEGNFACNPTFHPGIWSTSRAASPPSYGQKGGRRPLMNANVKEPRMDTD